MGRDLTAAVAAIVLIGCAAATPSNVPLSVTTLPSSTSPAPGSPSASTMSVTATSVEAPSAPPGAIAVQAGEGPIFRPDVLETATGDFQIFLTSPPVDPDGQQAVPHNLGIRAPGTLDIIASSDFVNPGEASIVFAVSGLEPGTYQFICEVTGHAGAGMVGVLTVAGS